VVLNALTTAVAHAEQKEWTDRPGYQNGLAAYDYWALMFERWAMIVNRDDPDRIGADICTFAQYNAGHYYGARCYAREFLNNIAGRNAVLHRAASCYGSVASSLEPVWKNSPKSKKADPKILIELLLKKRASLSCTSMCRAGVDVALSLADPLPAEVYDLVLDGSQTA